MSEYPREMMTRGPTPTVGGPITLIAQSDMDENTVVTFGTEDQTCEKCGVLDFPLGWLQAAVDEDEVATVSLFAPVWLVRVSSLSAVVTFGDTLECAAAGEVRRAQQDSGATIFGKAMQDGEGEGIILAMPIVCCPSYTTT